MAARSIHLDYCTATALWYRQGRAPVPMRWVLVRAAAPQDRHSARFRPTAFFASDPNLPAERIIASTSTRWNIEVTFEELRADLGFQDAPRQWSERAIERTTPCLLGLFSLVVLMAQALHPTTIPVRQTTWYVKEEAPLPMYSPPSGATYGAYRITTCPQLTMTCCNYPVIWSSLCLRGPAMQPKRPKSTLIYTFANGASKA